MEKVEKTAVLMSGKKRTGVSNFVESLQASTLAMNAKTVEICAVVTFFTIGTHFLIIIIQWFLILRNTEKSIILF